MPADRVRELVLAAAELGHPCASTPSATEPSTRALDIFGEAQAWYGAPHAGRNTLEHLENLLPQDIDRLADALGIWRVPSPGTSRSTRGPELFWGRSVAASGGRLKTYPRSARSRRHL